MCSTECLSSRSLVCVRMQITQLCGRILMNFHTHVIYLRALQLTLIVYMAGYSAFLCKTVFLEMLNAFSNRVLSTMGPQLVQYTKACILDLQRSKVKVRGSLGSQSLPLVQSRGRAFRGMLEGQSSQKRGSGIEVPQKLSSFFHRTGSFDSSFVHIGLRLLGHVDVPQS